MSVDVNQLRALEMLYEALSCSIQECRYDDALLELAAYEKYGGDINDLLNDAGIDATRLGVFTRKLHDN